MQKDGRPPQTFRLTIPRYSAENKWFSRESRQCPVPHHLGHKVVSGGSLPHHLVHKVVSGGGELCWSNSEDFTDPEVKWGLHWCSAINHIDGSQSNKKNKQ